MAGSATARRPARRGLTLGKPKDGPQPVGAAAGKKQGPNKFLLGVLGVVALAAGGRLAMPGMFGGGAHGVATFPAPLTNRHLATRVTTTTVPGGGTGGGATRSARNPFTPPAGYGS